MRCVPWGYTCSGACVSVWFSLTNEEEVVCGLAQGFDELNLRGQTKYETGLLANVNVFLSECNHTQGSLHASL